MAIADHVSRRMLERYSHIRLEAKQNALQALSYPKKKGYGTNGGTKTDEKVSVPPIDIPDPRSAGVSIAADGVSLLAQATHDQAP
jgi:hypothetical protein